MLYSSQTSTVVKKFGIKEGIAVLADAGYPCLDLGIYDYTDNLRQGNWRELAKEYRDMHPLAEELFLTVEAGMLWKKLILCR